MRTWFITGCSSGIGRGIAKAALNAGNQVVVTARNIEKLKELTEFYPDKAYAVTLDVSKLEDIEHAVKAACDKFGTIDVLVNNAGYGYRSAIEESEMDEIQRLFQVNCFGPIELIQKVLPLMREKKSGTIINITSIGGVRGAIGNGMYSAAKGAMELASDTLYKECKPLGIRVLTVEPGGFRTGFYSSLKGTSKNIKDYAETAGKWHIENMVNHYNQPGDPDDAGKIIVDMVEKEKLPKRLALGSDAVKIIRDEYEERLIELQEWSNISRQSDY